VDQQPQGTLVDPLRAEHAVLREAIGLLQRVVDRCARRQPIATGVVRELFELLHLFGDREHVAKEEQALIPALHAAGMPLRYGPLAIALLEHERARTLGRELAHLARDLAGEPARGRFVQLAGDYVRLMRGHLDREESQLFPMAAQVVPLERISAMREAFARIEEEVASGGPQRVRAQLEELGVRLLAG
jgi:hemerythrin-like domain-containing protein